MSDTRAILALAAVLLVTFAVLRTITVISNRRAARRGEAPDAPPKRGRRSTRKRGLKGQPKARDASRQDAAAASARRDEAPQLHRKNQTGRPAGTPLAAPARTGIPSKPAARTPPLQGARLATRRAPVHSPKLPPALRARPAPQRSPEPEPRILAKAPQKGQESAPGPRAKTGFVDPAPGRRLVQRIFFGTDRAGTGQSDIGPTFGDTRGEGLTLGHADILLPAGVTRIDGSRAGPEAGLITIHRPDDGSGEDRRFELQRVTHLAAQSFVNGTGIQARTARQFTGAALVYLHGFHTGFSDALFRTAQITHDLGFDGPACAFCWPSQSGAPYLAQDRASAEASVDALDLLLETILAAPGVRQVHVIAHSPGVTALAQLLSQKDTRIGGRSDRPLGQLVLAAPDMPTGDFESCVPHLTRLSQGVTLYASASDPAIRAARKLDGATPIAGDVPAAGPVIAQGIDSIDASAPGTGVLGLSRNEYLENRGVLADIAALLATGTRPPDRRGKDLHALPTARGTYWRIEA